MTNNLEVKIWRGRSQGRFQSFSVPARASQTVLDVVTYIQRKLDPTLTYRFACRVGMCGSCAMMVNGAPAWTCRTHVNKVAKNNKITLEPLDNLPVIRDLATDMAPFFKKWQRAEARFLGTKTRNDKIPAIDPSQQPRKAASAAIECINCAVCYAACDAVAKRDDYVGPAALNRSWSLYNDTKHIAQDQLKSATIANGGCFSCHTQANCTNHCPVSLDPAGSIAGLKKTYSLLGRLMSRGRP